MINNYCAPCFNGNEISNSTFITLEVGKLLQNLIAGLGGAGMAQW